MARTTTEVASILSNLYEETFSNDSYEPFRITWANLRMIAGVSKLTPQRIRKINYLLSESDCTLIPFDNFLVVLKEKDLSHLRILPPRLAEEHIYEEGEFDEPNAIEGTAVNDFENCEIDDEDVG